MQSPEAGAPKPVKLAVALLIVFVLLASVILFAKWILSSSSNNQTGTGAQFSLAEALRDEHFGGHVVSTTTDLRGNLWVGTADNGVFMCEPSAVPQGQWTHFSASDGLGDNSALALACDRLGRMWVGHLNHGVSVYAGHHWQQYDVVGAADARGCLCGPLGNHVRAIAICPSDGDVWMATNAGLARYSESAQQWNYYTRAQGLCCDQANAISFDPTGNIYLATPCEGVVMGNAQDAYKTWRQANGPQQLLTEPDGMGLPSNMINDVLMSSDGTLYAATPAGLGWSGDHGLSWHFIRGQDWADKVRNSVAGPPQDWSQSHEALLAEDDITCLAEEAGGTVDIGYGQSGWGRVARNGETLLIQPASVRTGLVKCLSAGAGRYSVAGTEGGRVLALDESNVASLQSLAITPPAAAAFPAGAEVKSHDEINRWLSEIASVPPTAKTIAPLVVPLADDWTTQGDWIGRYGRYTAVIAAISNPVGDYLWGAGPTPMKYSVQMGDHHEINDSIRYYIASLYTKDPRVLEIPPVYLDSRVIKKLTTRDRNRRQAEWNDNSETYPATYEGPDMYCTVSVPAGLFVLAFYEVNNDGRGGRRSLRDVELVVKQSSTDNQTPWKLAEFNEAPTLAFARASDFWSGVYKRFCVQGPCGLIVRLHRSYGDIAKVSGLMLDLVDEHPVPYFSPPADWDQEQQRRRLANDAKASAWAATPTHPSEQSVSAEDDPDAAAKLLDKLDAMRDWNPSWWAMNHREIAVALARWYEAQAKSAPLNNQEQTRLATCLYYSGLYMAWEDAEHAAGKRTARDIEKALRWNQAIPAFSGRGFKTVTEYLAGHPAEK